MTRGDRFSLLSARVGSLVLDALLVAYALWCVSFLLAGGGYGFLHRYPAYLLSAPIFAVVWQMSGTSLGQRGYRMRFVTGDGAAAGLDRRVVWAFAAALLWAAVPGIALSTGPTPLGWILSALVFAAAAFVSLARRDGRSAPEVMGGLALTLRRREETGPLRPWYARSNPWVVFGLLLLTFAVGIRITGFSPARLVEGAGDTGVMWRNLLDPDWSITAEVIEKMVETVFLALMASTLALPFAFLISFFGARNLMTGSAGGRVAYALTRVCMNVTRSVEPLVWAVIFVVWVKQGPFAGMLALFVHSVAALGKLYSEAIESIDPGPVEAIRATGANFAQTVRYGVVPQVVPPFLSFTVYRWDINVRMATILGLIGGGGIGGLLIEANQLGNWSKVGTIIVFITLVVWLMDVASSKARERLG